MATIGNSSQNSTWLIEANQMPLGINGIVNNNIFSLSAEQNNIITDDNIILKSIRDYNEIDCKVMFEIITYLRNNHI